MARMHYAATNTGMFKKRNMAFKTSNIHSKDGKDVLALFLSRNISKCIVNETQNSITLVSGKYFSLRKFLQQTLII